MFAGVVSCYGDICSKTKMGWTGVGVSVITVDYGFQKESQMEESLMAVLSPDSVRLAVLEMSRVTEQVAILASYAIGCRRAQSVFAPTVRQMLCQVYLECLDNSLTADARLVHIDPRWLGFVERPRWNLGSIHRPYRLLWNDHPPERRYGRLPVVQVPNERTPSRRAHRDTRTTDIFLPLDIIMFPLEGVDSTLDGLHGGSASILAGGPRGAFDIGIEQDESREARPSTKRGAPKLKLDSMPYFFVIATGEESVAKECASRLGKEVNGGGPPQPIEKVPAVDGLFDCLSNWKPVVPPGVSAADQKKLEAGGQATVATIKDEAKFGFASLLDKGFRRRRFTGSSTAAAVTALYRRFGVHLFAAVVRRSTALLIATAARGLGRSCFVIELEIPEDKKCHLVCPTSARVFRETELVREDTFLVMTGVSAHPLLKGVRIHPDGTAHTQTLAVNGRSRSVRFLHHYRDLKRDLFRSLDGTGALVEGWDIIGDFRQKLIRE